MNKKRDSEDRSAGRAKKIIRCKKIEAGSCGECHQDMHLEDYFTQVYIFFNRVCVFHNRIFRCIDI